ncbi:MAG: hypothetical protein ACPG4W_01175 [Flavobacteriales bacterium]
MKFRFSPFLFVVFFWMICFQTQVFGQRVSDENKQVFVQSLKQEIYPFLHAEVYREGKIFLEHFKSKSSPKEALFIKLMKAVRQEHLSVTEDYLPIFQILNAFYDNKIDETACQDLLEYSFYSIKNQQVITFKQVVKNLALFITSDVLWQNAQFEWKTEHATWRFSNVAYPNIEFSKLDLKLKNQSNQLLIKNSSGSYNLINQQFTGFKGQINWAAHQVELNYFQFDLKRNYIETSDADLESKALSKSLIKGIFSFRLLASSDQLTALEPQFISTEIIPIKNYHPDVFIQSGIHLKGSQLDLMSPKGISSKIEFVRDKKTFVRLEAQKFTLENDQFFARDCIFHLFYQNDSISHPAIDLKYDLINEKLHAKTSDSKLGQSPFYDGLHQLQILADHLYWEKEKGQLIFQNNQSSKLVPVAYQSARFFDKHWFIDLFDFTFTHPTTPLWIKLQKQINQRAYYIEDIRDIYNHKSIEDSKNLMVLFANQGFVHYNVYEEKVIVKDRFISFVTALNKKEDFDKIRFESKVNNRPSGIIDIESGILEVNHVSNIYLNFKKQVTIYPSDNIVQIYPNLDMEFNGMTTNGKLGFFGDNQFFNYDEYRVEFTEIDSFRYLLETPLEPEDSLKTIRSCKTVFQDFTGVLELDKPHNKSGKKKSKQYPILKAEAHSRVYYDQVRGGLYPKSDFYFDLDAFTLTSTLKLKTEKLEFSGHLFSQHILPKIEETLVLNDKDELGFERKTQAYPLYGDDEFGGALTLSNSGLTGSGKLQKEALLMNSDSIDFYPEYLYAQVNQAQTQVTNERIPQLNAKNLDLHWFESEDWLELTNKNSKFDINSNTKLDGGIEYHDQTFEAFGTLYQENVLVRSDSFELENQSWKAKLAKLNIYPEGQTDFLNNERVLEAKELDLVYEYPSQRLMNEDDSKSHRFHSPYLNYQFTFPQLTYEMQSSELFFESEVETVDSNKNQSHVVESLNPYTGPIRYVSPTALIDMESMELVLIDLDGVQIADAIIRPKAEELKLLSTGLPEKLREANIDLVDKKGAIRYRFNEAEIDIISGDDFLAKAQLNWSNRLGDVQKTPFNELSVVDEKTQGHSELSADDEPFMIDPNLQFRGQFELNPAESSSIQLDGEIQFQNPCSDLDSDWFLFKDSLVNQTIVLQHPKEKKAQKTGNYLIFNTESRALEAHILKSTLETTESPLCLVSGSTQYSDSLNAYLSVDEHQTNQALFSVENCQYEYEGKFQLNHHPLVESSAFCRVLFEENNQDSLVFQGHFGIELPLNSKAKKRFRKDLKSWSKAYETTYEDSDLFRKYLSQLIGKESVGKYFKAKRRGRDFVPLPMQHDLFLTDIDFEWNAETSYFEHRTDLEVNQADSKKIDRILPGFIRYRPGKDADYLAIFISISADEFYYFEWNKSTFYTSSSNEKYMKIIQEKPKNKSKKDTHLHVEPYLFPIHNLD